MLLRKIAVLMMWAVLASPLIRPWFWKALFTDRNFYAHYKTPGLSNSCSPNLDSFLQIFLQIVAIIIIVGAGAICLGDAICSVNFYGTYGLVIICCLAQQIWSNQRILKRLAFFIVAAIVFSIGMQNTIMFNKVEIPEIKIPIESNEKEEALELLKENGLTYFNGKYIFSSDGQKEIVVIEEEKTDVVKVIKYSVDFNIDNIRKEFPTKALKKLWIAVDENDIPYGIYANCKKDSLFGKYYISSYIALNLQTGDIIEFTDLPIE